MSKLSQKYSDLKQKIGGNREITHYEETFGMPREEYMHITPPNKYIRRILGELDFAIRLSDSSGAAFEKEIESALDLLLEKVRDQGVITKADCKNAEKLMLPLKETAKQYKLILAGHAHIDMNWMWSWHETVAATLATFRTMLDIMNEYPDFCFSQSQAAVYKIAEEFDPELAEEIKKRIHEGRWEVTASAWVETDKNMPNTESLLRHIKYTKRYMKEHWGVDADKLEVDFSPDTFGHSAHIPEIDMFSGVKYYYHCRALDGDQALYRWKSPSGKELLCYREQYWYNSGITPKIGAGIIDISRRCSGFKTGLIVYGVGDHGGGPTRRDIERAVEMASWPIFPQIKFGTLSEFFAEAESVRDSLPVVDHELNYFAPGCYTTQSRLKKANRACERALVNAEAMAAMANVKAGVPFSDRYLEKAWQNVLFTHFHDILTGSCVQDSREHAMGLFSESLAAAQTMFSGSMKKLTDKINTSGIETGPQDPDSQAEGAGAGYGVDGFTSSMPRSERGNGKTRIFCVFNPTPVMKDEPVEITVWDWTADLRRVSVTDAAGNDLPFQLLSSHLETYWDHKYFKVLVMAKVAPYGYTTVVLREKELEGDYPIYFQGQHRTNGNDVRNFVLENEYLRAEFDCMNGQLVSLKDTGNGREFLKAGAKAGLRLVDTECATSNAWCIGNYLKVTPVDKAVRICRSVSGALRNGFYTEYRIRGSVIKQTIYLDRGAKAFNVSLDIDWHEAGGDTIPVLTYELPAASADSFLYDVPAGAVSRTAINHDVPGLQYGAAVNETLAKCVAVVNEGKYGYRGCPDGTLVSTFINSATSPDPYPERGRHRIEFAVGVFDADRKILEDNATSINNKLSYQPALKHDGTLPTSGNLFGFSSASSVISAIEAEQNGLLIRLYNTGGTEDTCGFVFDSDIDNVSFSDNSERAVDRNASVSKNTFEFSIAPYSLLNVTVKTK